MSVAEACLYICKRFNISPEHSVRICANLLLGENAPEIKLKREAMQGKNIKHSYHPFIVQQLAKNPIPQDFSNAYAHLSKKIKHSKQCDNEQKTTITNTLAQEIQTLREHFKDIKIYSQKHSIKINANTLHDIMQEYNEKHIIYNMLPYFYAQQNNTYSINKTLMSPFEDPVWQENYYN